MTNCCNKILSLGCIAQCENLETEILATETGTYIIKLVPGNIQITTFTGTSGQPLVIPNVFNENSVSTFQIYLPSGDVLTETIEEVEYDCFSVDSSPSNIETPAPAESSSVSSCCNQVQSLGCVDQCTEIETTITATSTGTYSIRLVGGINLGTFEAVEDEDLTLPNYFNENGVSVFQIFDPDGNVVEQGEYNCFSVTAYGNAYTPSNTGICPTLCQRILAATTEEIINCLSEEQEQEMIEELCAGGVCEYEIQIQGVPTGQTVTLTNCEDLTINIV